MTRLLLPIGLLAVVAAGCRKPLPSLDFIEASGKYTSLVALEGDDAYASAEMDYIEKLLQRVPEKSADYAAALALAEQIRAERARVEKAKAAATTAMEAPVAMPPLPPPVAEARPAEPVAAAKVDLLPGAQWEPTAKEFAGCLSSRGKITITGVNGGETDAWETKLTPECQLKLPELVGSVALVRDGKVVQLAPKTALVVVQVEVPADAGPLPDAGR